METDISIKTLLSDRLLAIDWIGVGVSVIRPLLTLVIWYVVHKMIGKLHGKSKFVDRLFSRMAGSDVDKAAVEARIHTFRGLFYDILKLLAGVFFVFILLEDFGIDIKPLLAGVGFAGLGISLAAQNILRDFLNGFFILCENQYDIGDWIEVNGKEGTVEDFSLRVTKLRTVNGDLVMIPNGQISQVANSTKLFSTAVVRVGVGYSEDTGRALAALERAIARVRADMGDKVRDDGVSQGILDFRDRDMLLRAMLRTAPGSQWEVERRLRVVIKEEFDKDGIEIPAFRVAEVLK